MLARHSDWSLRQGQMLWWGGGGGGRCIITKVHPMSTIDGYCLPFGTPTAARGAAHGFWCSHSRQGALWCAGAQPEVVQTNGARICLLRTYHLLLASSLHKPF